jgi:CBS-domain-containing membrane protein
MTVGVETCSLDTPIASLARILLENGGVEIVVLEEGNAVGRIGQEQLMQAYTRQDYDTLTASDILVEGVPQVPADIPLAVAAQIMLDQGVKTLFLMHHAGGIEYPAASISYRHILRHMSAQREEDLQDLGIYAERVAPLQAFIQRRDTARRQNKTLKE